ncbi:MAG: ankyrin repeat domain-containing protein [Chlamydiota bacterium]
MSYQIGHSDRGAHSHWLGPTEFGHRFRPVSVWDMIKSDAYSEDRIISILKDLSNRGFDPCAMDPWGNTTVLYEAICARRSKLVRFALSLIAPERLKNHLDSKCGGEELSALHVACAVRDLNAVQLLCEKGASVSVKDRRGYSPVHLASLNGDVELLTILVGSLKGSDRLQCLNDCVVTSEGLSALHLACMGGNLDAIHFLLANGAYVSVTDSSGRTPLEIAETEEDSEVVDAIRSFERRCGA